MAAKVKPTTAGKSEVKLIENMPSKALGTMLKDFRAAIDSCRNAGIAMLDWAARSMGAHKGELSDHDVEQFVNVAQDVYGADWRTAKTKEKSRSNWRKVIQARAMLADARAEVKKNVADCNREFVLTLSRQLLAGKTVNKAMDAARGKHQKKVQTPEAAEKAAWGRVRAALQNLYLHGKPAGRKAAIAAAEILNPQWDLAAESKKAAAKK